MITLEQGKTLADAEGDVFRGLREYNLLTCVKKKLFGYILTILP